MPKEIALNFKPEFIKDYCGKWVEQMKKDGKNSPAEVAMAKDILTLVGVACEYLVEKKETPKTN